MQINADALVSLQIFLDEKHASIYSDAVKEGLSIYGETTCHQFLLNSLPRFFIGILNQTRTALGRNLLRQWLLRPSMSLKVIKERHDTVACFVNSENIPTSDRIHRNIGGLKGAPLALTRLRKGKATLQNWRAMVQVRNLIRPHLKIETACPITVLGQFCDASRRLDGTAT